MTKKIVIYLGSLLALIIIVVVFIVYLNAKNKAAENSALGDIPGGSQQTEQRQNQQQETEQQNSESTASQNRVTRFSDEPVISPILNLTGDAYWYFAQDGSVYKVNFAKGLKQEFLISEKKSVTEGIWPQNGSDFIVVSGKDKNRSFSYFSTDSKEFTSYPANFKGIDFSADAKAIYYNFVKGDKSYLSSGDLLNTEFQNIAEMPEAGLAIKASPGGKALLAYNKDDNQNGKLYLVLLDAKRVVTLKTNTDNSALWSPDGKHFVYNRDPLGDKTGKNLWLGDSTAPTDKDLGISTLVSKVAFDREGNNLYAAVAGSGGSDQIWKIDLNTLAKSLVFETKSTDSPNQINAGNLLISPDSSSIYFTNSDNYLYGIKVQ